MHDQLRRCLDDLASRIDEEQELAVRTAWEAFLQGDCTHDIFQAPRRRPSPAKAEWPLIPIHKALHDPELMVLSQFASVSELLTAGGSAIPCVRCNYGVSILVSQLGCPVVEMPPEQPNTPTARPLPNGLTGIRDAIQKGVPDTGAGQGADVWAAADLFLETFARWPVLGRWVSLYHPDLQGPIDNAELAWGSQIFYAFYDEPDLVHSFLDLMTNHYIAFMQRWFRLVPPHPQANAHWGLLHPGNIVLRNDSLMNLSPDIYCEWIRDHDRRCLKQLGGGMIHYCGRGDHFIAAMAELQPDGLHAVNLSQPELNDMEIIFTNTVDRGISLIGLHPTAAENALRTGRPLHGRVHVFS